jgi:hypothetical protein
MAGTRQRLVLAGAILATLTACEVREEAPVASDFAGEAISCALAGVEQFQKICSYERYDVEGERVLVIHHPDAGFRRFTMLDDGRGLEVADGADEAVVEAIDGMLQVTVVNDRYRLPATIRSGDAAE